VGLGPIGIAFDGANVWVTNRDGGTVSKLRASDGKTLGTFSVVGSPYGVAFDGSYVWVAGSRGSSKMRVSNGTVVGQFGTDATIGVAFDGANVWISNLNNNFVEKF
jgi:DNA-binding beta-propeller fold protein YncE